MWTTDEQRHRDHRWAAVLAAMGVAGAWTFVRVPRPLLRGHWDTSLAWMMVLSCCGVAAGAVWSGRQYCRTVAPVLSWAVAITWALVLTAADPYSVPGVSLPVLVGLTVVLYPLNLYVAEPL
jgi:hypothetical protein